MHIRKIAEFSEKDKILDPRINVCTLFMEHIFNFEILKSPIAINMQGLVLIFKDFFILQIFADLNFRKTRMFVKVVLKQNYFILLAIEINPHVGKTIF